MVFIQTVEHPQKRTGIDLWWCIESADLGSLPHALHKQFAISFGQTSEAMIGCTTETTQACEPLKSLEREKLYSRNEVPCEQSEWRVVRAVVTKDRDERDAPVKSWAEADPRQYQLENSEVNVPQEYS